MNVAAKRRVYQDILFLFGLSTIVCILAITFNFAERFHHWVEENKLEHFQVDEALVGLSILSFAFAIFSVRRWRDAQRAIEDQMRAEAELENQKHRSDCIVSNISDIVTILSPDGTVRYESPSIQRILGYTPEELVGKNPFDFIHPDDVTEVLAKFKEGMATQGRTVLSEFRFRHKEGSWQYFEAVGTNLQGVPGVGGMLVVSRDLTWRKAAENALYQSNEMLKTLVEASPAGITVLDLDGKVKLWNAAAEQMFGWTSAEVIGRVLPTVPEDKRDEFRAVCDLVRNDDSLHSVEVCRQRRSGTPIEISLSAAPLKDATGKITGIIGIMADISRRKLAREQNHLQSSALNAAANGIAITQFDGTILWVNPAFCKLTGYSAEELIGQNPRVLKSGEQPPEFYAEMWRTISAGNVWRGEVVNRRKDGTLYTEDMTITPVRNGGGKIGHFIAIKQDITDRKRAEQSLRELQRQQLALLNNIPDLAWVKDKECRYVAINEPMSKMYGRSATEIVGTTDYEMVPQDLAERYRADDRQVMESRQRKRIEEFFEDPAGRRTWVETIKTPFTNDKGEVIGSVGIARDITDRKVAEQALRESERRYSDMLGNVELISMMLDRDARVTFCNDYLLRLTGWQREEVLGSDWFARFIPAENTGLKDVFAALVANHPSAWHHENEILTRSGERRLIRWNNTVLRSPSGEVIGTASIGEDITEHKRAEQDLQESNRRLQNALEELNAAESQVIQQERLRALGTMASGIAHDFNNALMPVLGFSELLLHRPGNLEDRNKARRYLELMNIAARDATSIVNRLRQFYRNRDEDDVFVPVDVHQLINEAVSLTRPKWEAEAQTRGINITVETDLKPVPLIPGSAPDLREVFTNLIFNAVDAMPQGGTITVRARRPNGHVLIEIADTGTGMTEEVRRRCLEPFFSTKGERGTGLGLSMVYGILQRHAGTVDIESTPGQGTTFKLRIPTVNATTPAKSAGKTNTDVVKSLRVLVVDDEPQVCDVISLLLKSEGHIVTTTGSGRQALETFRAESFDVALIDRAMPGMSGDQLAVYIKTAAPQLPVIMLTGFGSMMQAAGEKPADVDSVVSKPVTIHDLREALARVTPSSGS